MITRYIAAAFITSLLLSCSKPSYLGVESIFNKPIYLGQKINSADFRNLCDETEENEFWKACIVKKEELTAYFLVKKGKVVEIKLTEKPVNGSAKAIEAEYRALRITPEPIRLLGLGDYYRQENRYVLYAYTVPHKYGKVVIVDEVSLHLASDDLLDYTSIDEVARVSESSRVEYSGFTLGEKLISRNPAGFVCTTYKPLDITECLHENYWYYQDSYSWEENRFLREKTPHDSVDVLWLDGTRVVGMKKFFGDSYSWEVKKLLETFGGKRKFSRIITGSKYDAEPDIGESLYTVDKNGDLVIIESFWGSVDLELHSGESSSAKFFLERQQSLSTQ